MKPGIDDVLCLAGTGLLSYAGYRVDPTIGFAVGGLLLLVFGLLLARSEGRK